MVLRMMAGAAGESNAGLWPEMATVVAGVWLMLPPPFGWAARGSADTR